MTTAEDAISYTYLYFRGGQGTWYSVCLADFSWYGFMIANKPWTNMSGQINMIGVSLPNQIKQNKLKTVYMWSWCYKAGCHQIGGGVCEMEVPPVLQKTYTIFMSLLLVTLSLSPVALNHYNKVTIGFVIHKNLQIYVHDISNLLAAKWGRLNRQIWLPKLKVVAAILVSLD